MQMTDMIKVWDPRVRAFHWALAATFFVAYVTEDEVMTLHVWADSGCGSASRSVCPTPLDNWTRSLWCRLPCQLPRGNRLFHIG